MATSSITKDFIVKDVDTFKKLLEKVNNVTDRTVTVKTNTSLSKGREKLKQFSPR